MPVEAFGLALAAAFYPPAVVAMIALVHGDDIRRRVFVYLAGAALMTFGAGVAALAVLDGSGAIQRERPTPSAAVEIALGAASVLLATKVWRRPPGPAKPAEGQSRTERLTRRLDLVFVLGFVMYAPSPLYLGAMKVVADAHLTTSANAALVLVLGSIVLLMVEVPALLVVLAPDRGTSWLETSNAWLRRNTRALAGGALMAGGVYLALRGLVHLAG